MTTSGEATRTLCWAGGILVQAGTPDGFSVALRYRTTVTPRHRLLVTELQAGSPPRDTWLRPTQFRRSALGPKTRKMSDG